jgi:hypothetical protein
VEYLKQNQLLVLALASSILVILLEFFQWYLVDILTEFLMLPVWLVIFGFFIFITIKATIRLFKKNKDWKPLTIQIITILLWFYFPFTQVILDLDFKSNRSE